MHIKMARVKCFDLTFDTIMLYQNQSFPLLTVLLLKPFQRGAYGFIHYGTKVFVFHYRLHYFDKSFSPAFTHIWT